MITNTAHNTLVLNSLMENEQGKQALDKALSTYPLYAGKKKYDLIPTREELNNKLLNHYRFREIAFETAGRFLFELENTMQLIMPFYNEMFKTVEIMADLENPFDNVDVTEKIIEERTNTTTTDGETSNTIDETNNVETQSDTTAGANASVDLSNETTTTGKTTDKNNRTFESKFSDTPQNSITNIDNHLTEYRKETTTDNNETSVNDKVVQESLQGTTEESNSHTTGKNDTTLHGTNAGTSTTTSNSEGKTEHTYTKKGNQGVNTYAHDMIEFRESIRDFVDEIVNDYRIAELFMLVD